jgi:hypothetical protein
VKIFAGVVVMQVAYEVRDATFGKGLFTPEHIPIGTCIWDRSAANLKIVLASDAEKYVAKLDRGTLRTLLEYAYFGADGELIDLTDDDGRYFNHSNSRSQTNVALGSVLLEAAEANGTPPPDGIDPGSTYALRDIAAGEELLDDYNTYNDEPQWYLDLLSEHGVDTSYCQQPRTD